jgi:PAS domain S-box-containing protein
MNLRETLTQVADRLQIAFVIGSVPKDGSGDVILLHANSAAASLFGYPGPASMMGLDVRALMPKSVAADHQNHVGGYVGRVERREGRTSSSTIIGSWRNLEGVRKDGTRIHLAGNVADIVNSEERFFVAIFRDRTAEVESEAKMAEAVETARLFQEEAEAACLQAEKARADAEDSLLKQKRLSGQITLLRQIFGGTVGLIVMLGVLVVAQWSTGSEGEGLSMIKDVLLVLTGILGSAMASVFDSRKNGE